MEGFTAWIRNLTAYFLFMTVVMNLLPEGEERRYVRMTLGVILLAVLFSPLRAFAESGESLAGRVAAGLLGETGVLLQTSEALWAGEGEEYLKEAYESQIEKRLGEYAETRGFQLEELRISFIEDQTPAIEKLEVVLACSGEDAETIGEEEWKTDLAEILEISEENLSVRVRE